MLTSVLSGLQNGLVPVIRLAMVLTAATALPASTAAAQQIQMAIDPKASLAWWEINPNMSHLWATTCPQDPAWQPGEGRSIDAMVDYVRRNKTHVANLSDTTKIPLYPRKVVRALCTPAVTGEFVTSDTLTFRGTKGQVSVQTKDLVTGLDYRDEYARKAIYGTESHPELSFRVDSLINLRTTARGDTTHAIAVGSFELRGIRTPMQVPLRIRREGGGLRVQAQTHVPASQLVAVYGISKMALGMSVGLKVWKDLYMGVDVILRPVPRDS